MDAARTALWNASAEWDTAKAGRHGSSKKRSLHGGPLGSFKIVSKDAKGTPLVLLYAATDNTESLPELEGGTPTEAGDTTERNVDKAQMRAAVSLLIAPIAKSIDQVLVEYGVEEGADIIRALTTCSRILAGNVKEVADKYGCPSEHTRKGDHLDWLLKTLASE